MTIFSKTALRAYALAFFLAGVITAGYGFLGGGQQNNTFEGFSQPEQAEIISGASMQLTITPDSTSESITQDLADHKLIDNANEFKEFLEANGYHENLVSGDYEISTSMSYRDIAEKITGGE